jgi:hypothetical protein
MFSPFRLLPGEKRPSSLRIAGTIVQIILAEQVFLCTKWYFRTTKLRSAMARTMWYSFTGCASLAEQNTVAVNRTQSPRWLDLCYLGSKSNGLR